MLSYQHAFHAGNHADILKHYVLTFVISSLNRKDKPYTFFDTHSGSGLYDLFDNRSIKTGEAEKGIEGLLKVIKESDKSTLPSSFIDYLNLVEKYTSKNLYPGSPEVERQCLRKQDTLILSELHPQEIENLKSNMAKNKSETDPSIKIHYRNGWEMIKALTPPSTKRGAVLIDPSYEETQDYIDAFNVISEINRKWSNGIIMLWYPLLAHRESEIDNMIKSITLSCRSVNKNTEISNLHLKVYDKDNENLPRLYGSGMMVINSPWKLEEDSKNVISFVEKVLSPLYK